MGAIFNKQNAIIGVLGAIGGFVLCLVIFVKGPDVKTIHDVIHITTHDTSTSFITIIAHATVTGGTSATINSNGSVVVSGSNLSISTSSQTSTTLVTVHDQLSKENKSETDIKYQGYVYALWGEIRPFPAIVGVNYTVVGPVAIQSELNIDIKHLYVGAGFKF